MVWGDREVVHRKEESKMSYQDLLRPLRMGAEMEERPQMQCDTELGIKWVDLDIENGRKNKDLKPTYMFHRLTCFSGRLD